MTPHLARALLTDALDEACVKAQRGCVENASMPKRLLAASMWLAGQGYEAEPTPAELYFGWGMDRCRKYLGRLSRAAFEAEMEAGRRSMDRLLANTYLTAATDELTEARVNETVEADQFARMAALYAEMNRDVDRRAAA